MSTDTDASPTAVVRGRHLKHCREVVEAWQSYKEACRKQRESTKAFAAAVRAAKGAP